MNKRQAPKRAKASRRPRLKQAPEKRSEMARRAGLAFHRRSQVRELVLGESISHQSQRSKMARSPLARYDIEEQSERARIRLENTPPKQLKKGSRLGEAAAKTGLKCHQTSERHGLAICGLVAMEHRRRRLLAAV